MSDTDDDILREVRDRFEHIANIEGTFRQNAAADERFLHADAYNHGQWDDAEYRGRSNGSEQRPCLVINKTKQHVMQILNDARQSQMGVKIVATGFGASQMAAEALEGIVRHIEAQSNAQQNAYANAIGQQVGLGRGWVHVITDYVRGADTFDQDVFLESVPDWRSVYFDPDCKEPDCSDGRYGMLVTTMSRAEFERDHPRDADEVGDAPIPALDERDSRGWDTKETVRVAKYYRRSDKHETLWNVPPLPQLGIAGGPMRESDMPDGMADYCREQGCQKRDLFESTVEWFLIGGNRIVDRGDSVFKRIPLVPFIGEQTRIDGNLDFKGLTRALLDPQRMTNYAASGYIETIAGQSKAPWLTADASVDGFDEWNDSNIESVPRLRYRVRSDEGIELPPPSRIEPPTASTGHGQALELADGWMQQASGQYAAELGRPSNERSGRAINERQRQSDTANYHFTDNQGMALRCIGRLILDGIAAVYDVTRAVNVLALDGSQQQAIVDSSQNQAHAVHMPNGPIPAGADPQAAMKQQGAILAINPKVGRYDVQPDVGPAYATQRQQAADAFMQLAQAYPPLMERAGDIVFKALDVPLADEIAQRLAPPSADPAAAAAQQQIQTLQAQLAHANQQLKDKSADLQLRAADLQHRRVDDVMASEVDRYKAETDRVSAIGSIDPALLMPLVQQAVRDALATQIGGGQVPAQAVPMQQPAPQQPMPAVGTPTGTDLARLPSTNPPGGPVRSPVPSNGAVQ